MKEIVTAIPAPAQSLLQFQNQIGQTFHFTVTGAAVAAASGGRTCTRLTPAWQWPPFTLAFSSPDKPES